MTQERRPVTLEDFWSLRTVSDMQLSPDGASAAYVVGTYDERSNAAHSAIWLADVASGAARRFTGGEAADMAPRWSPDGRRLAFVSTRHEGKPQVFVIDRDGGEPRRLTAAEGGASSPAWSPDGRSLCYVSAPESDRQKVPQEVAWFKDHPDADPKVPRLRLQNSLFSRMDGRGYAERRMQLFVIDAGGDAEAPLPEPRQLTEGDYDCLQPAWSPDGESIAFLANRGADAERSQAWVTDVWTVALEGGTLRQLTRGDLGVGPFAWSPDGESIVFYAAPDWITYGFRQTDLWLLPRDGGEPRNLSGEVDRSFRGVQPDYEWPDSAPLAWSPDGATLYGLLIDRGDEAVFAFDLASGHTRRVSQPGMVVTGVQCGGDGETLVVLASTPTEPFDVFTMGTDDGALRPLARTNRAWLAERALALTERITCTGPDGWEIEGWLVTPAHDTAARHPLILHVHGGPYGAWGNTFYFQAQALAGNGYASLYVNPRGSLGYGHDFAAAADWGRKDFQDLMAGVDAAIARGTADPERMAVTGISYGGFMTNWAVGHTDRFAAGVSVNGVSSFFSMYGVSDITAVWFENGFDVRGPFWRSAEHLAFFRDRSPITYADDIEAPLLLIQSEDDYRCPIEQGEQMLTALRMRGRVVELIRFPGASHVIAMSGTPLQRYLQWRLARDWFDRYLTPPAGTATTEAGDRAAVTLAGTPSIADGE